VLTSVRRNSIPRGNAGMKTFQEIEIAREQQNMIGYPLRTIQPWHYQFTREDFYHPDEVRGCRWAIRAARRTEAPEEKFAAPGFV
jgi:hypothetical protein